VSLITSKYTPLPDYAAVGATGGQLEIEDHFLVSGLEQHDENPNDRP
jgi:hypothetical protein